MKIINEQLISGVVEQARKSPRLRMNYNFHESLQDRCHRFLNALEPGTFIPVHHHPDKDETFVILRGKVKVTTYNDQGAIIATSVISPESCTYGADIPRNVWHGLECLESAVLLECKAGPFVEHEVDGILEIREGRDIYLAGGCFWGTEHYFKQIEGVVETSVGFANGHTANPSYKDVYTDTTGYAETVHVKYNPDVVSVGFLLRMFFKAIDPTSVNRQGHDEGTRYRTGIYYTDNEDLPVIEKVFAEEQKNYQQPLALHVSQKGYPEHLRLVRFHDEEQDREFMFLTNAMELTAQQVADLYKNRWQIELFFKWLKQHLKIKKFWGTTENAVRIQIYSAICAYCLVAIVQHDMRLERSTYEVLQILSMSLTDTTHLRDLFDKTIFKNNKDRNGSSEPNLFNF